MVPGGVEKSIRTSRRASGGNSARTGTPNRPTPANSPMSRPCHGCSGASMAAPIDSSLSSWASCRIRSPIRPQTPLMPIIVFILLATSRIHLDRLDDFVQLIRHLHRPVGKARAADAAFAQNFVEGLLIGTVISHGCGRVFELVAGQDANHAFAGGDDALLSQLPRSRHAGGRGGLAA